MKKSRRYILWGILILIILCLVLTRCRVIKSIEEAPEQLKGDDGAVDWQGKRNQLDLMASETIAIPGFDELTFQADRTEQYVNFYNPETNHCLFIMSLFVEDKMYWKSGYVEAGKGYYNIKLSEPIAAGIYNAALQVQCFEKSGVALNSAKVNFKLIVLEDE